MNKIIVLIGFIFLLTTINSGCTVVETPTQLLDRLNLNHPIEVNPRGPNKYLHIREWKDKVSQTLSLPYPDRLEAYQTMIQKTKGYIGLGGMFIDEYADSVLMELLFQQDFECLDSIINALPEEERKKCWDGMVFRGKSHSRYKDITWSYFERKSVENPSDVNLLYFHPDAARKCMMIIADTKMEYKKRVICIENLMRLGVKEAIPLFEHFAYEKTLRTEPMLLSVQHAFLAVRIGQKCIQAMLYLDKGNFNRVMQFLKTDDMPAIRTVLAHITKGGTVLSGPIRLKEELTESEREQVWREAIKKVASENEEISKKGLEILTYFTEIPLNAMDTKPQVDALFEKAFKSEKLDENYWALEVCISFKSDILDTEEGMKRVEDAIERINNELKKGDSKTFLILSLRHWTEDEWRLEWKRERR